MPQRLQELGNLPMEERRNVARDMLPEIQQRVADLRQRVDRFAEPPQITTPEPRIEPPAQEILDRAPRGQLAIIEQQRQEDLERIRQERESAREERKTLTERLGQVFDRTSMEDKVRDERQAMGVQEQLTRQQQQLTKIEELSNTATHLIEQRDAAIGLIGQQGVATPFITGQQARIAEAYDRRISTTTALLGTQTALYEAQQGQIELALGMVDQIVNAYTYDTQMELQKATMFLDLNREELNELGSEYTQLFQESQRYWENQLAEEKSERAVALQGMVEFYEAGITPDDSPEEVAKKIGTFLQSQIPEDVKGLMAQYNPLGVDIKESDTFAQALEKVFEYNRSLPPEAPKIFGTQAEGRFEQYLNPETGQWEYRQITSGISPFDVERFKSGLRMQEAEFRAGLSGGGWVDPDTNEPMSAWDVARRIVETNPNLSDTELEAIIREEVGSDLGFTDIRNLIETSRPEQTDEQLKALARERFIDAKEYGASKREAEKMWREENDWPSAFELPEPERSVLDQIYPKVWYAPTTWGN